MGFIAGFFGVLAVVLVVLGIWGTIDERKEAKASGMCKHCGKEQATKKLPNGGFACKKCHKKIAPEQIEQNKKETREREAYLAEAEPVVVKAIHGTCGLYNSFTERLPDSAGGWDVHLTVTSRSSKTIKYVIAELIPYNTVGDVGYSPTVGAGAKNIRITGPLYPHGKLKDQIVKKCWYDIKMSRIGVGTVQVVFEDGTVKTFRQE